MEHFMENDDVTMVGLISGEDENDYRVEVNTLSTWYLVKVSHQHKRKQRNYPGLQEG